VGNRPEVAAGSSRRVRRGGGRRRFRPATPDAGRPRCRLSRSMVVDTP